MEISEREYFELKEQVRLLQEKVNGIKEPKKELCNLVSELPIHYIHKSTNEYPDFKYTKDASSDAWKVFIQLAKILHTTSFKFVMDETRPGSRVPYIRCIGHHEIPKRITAMTNEQIAMSVQMLNEMIPIYNKYFMQTHEYVLYSNTNDGQYRRIYVEKEIPEECELEGGE